MCKCDGNTCIIFVTFLSYSYIQFLLYVVLLFKQPQLLSMQSIIISEQQYVLTRRENNALFILTIYYLCWDLSSKNDMQP
jgi:hypothetical protein